MNLRLLINQSVSFIGEKAEILLGAIFPIAMALMSGGLLFASFSPFDLSFLTWIALVPLFTVIMGKKPGTAFFLLFVCSTVFFVGLFGWIFEVPAYGFLHHCILDLYLGLWLGLFGIAFSCISMRWSALTGLFAAPFIWVALEYVRSNFFFLALPWGLLAHSQHGFLQVIQAASVIGVYGVSFLIVLVNAAIAGLIYPFFGPEKGALSVPGSFLNGKKRVVLSIVALFFTSIVLIYGHLALLKPIQGEKIKVSVIQGNVPVNEKRSSRYSIMKTYTDLTMEASKNNPSLIIWPESSVPGSMNMNSKLYDRMRGVAQTSGRYLLFGSSKRQKFKQKNPEQKKSMAVTSLNTAYLIPPEKGLKSQQYDKIHLLPFGEYTPLKRFIPWSRINIPDVSEYVPGEDFTIFQIPRARFGVTICWENVFPHMARQFVKRGAQFIVNITNEAWFGETAAPYQFLSMSIFRAVENRVYVVRCANTGVSCFIDPYGRVVDRVKNKNGQDTFVRGTLTEWVIPLESSTLYTRYGDWFAWLCIVCSAIFLMAAFFWKDMKKHETNINKRIV